MQFIDLQSQYTRISENINSRIQAILNQGNFIMGPEVVELENVLAEYTGSQHAIAVSSGTDALLIALLALELKPGDEVITTPFSFFATCEVMMLIGVKPVFVDIEPNTYNINPTLIEKAITSKTKAIIPVSLYGQCADFNAINSIAEKYHLPVIEDAAQSFGAEFHGKKSCNVSTIGCTSFFPSKPLGCYGDGGACFTNDASLSDKMRQIRLHGQERRYEHTRVGINGRLDTLQAAILLEKMKIFPDEVIKRQEIGMRYRQLLAGTVKLQELPPHSTSVYGQFTIAVSNREKIISSLNESKIPTAVHYPKPMHLQPALGSANYKIGDYPVSEQAAKCVLSLPMHPYLASSTQDFICEKLIEAVNAHSLESLV